ncbi:phosphate signaling complex protein PhoU [Umboniibacter marinipuniceus]|uniref:Phosphate-specific transport system accessory protein PhoU n=1 Tax=Umboniibacter marinipuniceus TaxID=569599 RepID=A0A3M0AB53_9GAMM|nr:phosphate signaling complex protein PhoU [Umboniibacter marinipuniceus]RMA82100.1 PhoU-like phosphate uptake regulator [Umboniibacter marinipuniceus]
MMKLDGHISQRFNQDLEDIRSRLLEMGGLVEQQLVKAMAAFESGDSELGLAVSKDDVEVNRLEVETEDLCTKILVKRQPAASDLRMVLAVSRIVRDLERMGDEAAKIADLGVRLAEEGSSPIGYVECRNIATRVREMINASLDAFARYDAEKARETMRVDEKVDDEYASALRSLVTYMMEDPRSIKRVMNVMWTLRSLERIGDHATNVCEQIIYLVEGEDMRHSFK